MRFSENGTCSSHGLKPKLKRRLSILLALIAVATIVLNIIAYRQAYALLNFARADAPKDTIEKLTPAQKARAVLWGVILARPESKLSPDSLGSAARRLTIPGTNGIKLGAWYCPGADTNSLVILFHGYAADKTGLLPVAKAFLEMGYSVLLVDFRGSGESSESYTTVGYLEAGDVTAAVGYARDNFRPSRTILFGSSMGAVAILRAVSKYDVRPDAIIIESVFDRMLTTVQNRFKKMGVPSFPSAQLLLFWGGQQAGFNAFKHNPLDYTADVRCPILFLHGSNDTRAKPDEARRVFAAVSAPKQFHVFNGLGHESAAVRYPLQWKPIIREFLTHTARIPPPVSE